MKFVIRDRVPDMQKKLKRVFKNDIVIGVTEETSSRDGSDVTNALLAGIHENGSESGNIPARPFLGRGIESVKYDIGLCLAQAIKASLTDKPFKVWLERAGEIGAEGVQDFIKAGDFAPLKESTLASRRAKGNYSTAPLVDTGQMFNAITYDIRKNDD